MTTAGHTHKHDPGPRLLRIQPTKERLLAAVSTAREEIEARADADWKCHAISLLDLASQRGWRGLNNSGWSALHAARRLELTAMNETELRARAEILIAEAGQPGKVNEWRATAIRSLLSGPLSRLSAEKRAELVQSLLAQARDASSGKAEEWWKGILDVLKGLKVNVSEEKRAKFLEDVQAKPGALLKGVTDEWIEKARGSASKSEVPAETTVLAARVRLATLIRDEAAENEHFKTTHLRNLLLVTQVVLVLALIAFCFVSKMDYAYLTGVDPDHDRTLWCVLIMGTLGGAFSAMLSLSGAAARKRPIPRQVRDGVVTMIRPALGAVGALAVFLFAKSGILSWDKFTVPGILAMSFVAGYTERLVLKGVESVAGEDKKAT